MHHLLPPVRELGLAESVKRGARWRRTGRRLMGMRRAVTGFGPVRGLHYFGRDYAFRDHGDALPAVAHYRWALFPIITIFGGNEPDLERNFLPIQSPPCLSAMSLGHGSSSTKSFVAEIKYFHRVNA